MTCATFRIGLAALAALLAAGAARADDSVVLKDVKYGELCQIIHGAQGKVVVVDVWAEF
jgi:hypothetical protein